MNRPFCTTIKRTRPDDRTELVGVRILALVAIDTARTQLARCALATDWPPLGVVDAADLLDAARALLAEGGTP